MADATDGWGRSSAVVVAALLYGAWFAGLVALLAPRPGAFSALRLVAPLVPAVALWALPASAGSIRWLALANAVIAGSIALAEPVARACAAAAAYGDEQRFALRVPPAFAVLAALAVAAAAVGAAAGPLLIADGRVGVGVGATVVGWPVAAGAARSLHSFERRFVVLVPAGLVVADPLVLTDPVLLPRERMVTVRAAPAGPLDGAVDTRLGALAGGVVVRMDAPGAFSLRRSRRTTESRSTDTIAFTPLRPRALLRAGASHRLPVG